MMDVCTPFVIIEIWYVAFSLDICHHMIVCSRFPCSTWYFFNWKFGKILWSSISNCQTMLESVHTLPFDHYGSFMALWRRIWGIILALMILQHLFSLVNYWTHVYHKARSDGPPILPLFDYAGDKDGVQLIGRILMPEDMEVLWQYLQAGR